MGQASRSGPHRTAYGFMAAGFFLLTLHPIMPQTPAGAAPIGAGHALVWPAFLAWAYITAHRAPRCCSTHEWRRQEAEAKCLGRPDRRLLGRHTFRMSAAPLTIEKISTARRNAGPLIWAWTTRDRALPTSTAGTR